MAVPNIFSLNNEVYRVKSSLFFFSFFEFSPMIGLGIKQHEKKFSLYATSLLYIEELCVNLRIYET